MALFILPNNPTKREYTDEQRKRRTECDRIRRSSPEYREKERQYRIRNKDKIAERSKAWYEANREKYGRKKRIKIVRTIEEELRQRRNWVLKNKYGISFTDYEYLFEKQKGVCAICGEPPDGGESTKMLCVDHCHKTGKVRGLLCHKHNSAIGLLGDNVELVRKALEYLLTND